MVGLPNSLDPGYGIAMPLWGTRDDAAVQRVLDSPYAATYRLASDWTAGATTPYAAVRAIEDHLRNDYTYDPNVISHTYPLGSFLFDDRAGYCQQFAGAMGLMLRMMGIPSRVVAGFAPGTRHSDDGTFQVRDLDAHSWVEAYFRGIGWVTFDPTPAAAPAGSQSQHGELAGTRGPAPDPQLDPSSVKGGSDQSTATDVAASSGSGGGVPWVALGLVLALALAGCRRSGSWSSTAAAARSRPASWSTSRSASCAGRSSGSAGSWSQTSPCSALEHRYSAAGRGPLRRYLRMLREHRYAAETTPPPGPADRRALRSAISSGSLRRRLQGLLVDPAGRPLDAPVSEPSPFSVRRGRPGRVAVDGRPSGLAPRCPARAARATGSAASAASCASSTGRRCSSTRWCRRRGRLLGLGRWASAATPSAATR